MPGGRARYDLCTEVDEFVDRAAGLGESLA
jgi:hypothetical protein